VSLVGYPRYVSWRDFHPRSDEIAPLKHQKFLVNLHAKGMMVLMPMLMCGIAFSLHGFDITEGIWIAVIGVSVASIIIASEIQSNADAIISDRLQEIMEHSWRNHDLWERMVFYDDMNKAYWAQNPQETVHEWCVTNGVKATIAHYSDVMNGYFGIYISFPDDESEMLFKLKFMDKI
jgi:hypothetical protein